MIACLAAYEDALRRFHTLQQVAERGALPSLVSLSAQRSPDHDLRGVILHCLATLSVNTGLRDEILAEGALPVLCRTAKLRVTSLQLPVAAALANFCSSAGPSNPVFNAEECLAALEVLSQSSNADVQASLSLLPSDQMPQFCYL